MKKFRFMKAALLLLALLAVSYFLSCDGDDPFTPIGDEPGDWVDITESSGLVNTSSPFAYEGSALGPNLYKAVGWTVNDEAAVNGNVSVTRGSALGMIAFTSVPSPSIINGKLYQTIELEAGSYKLDVIVFNNASTSNTPFSAYIVVVEGNDLPDTYADAAHRPQSDVASETIACLSIPRIGTTSTNTGNTPLQNVSVEFNLTEAKTVSLGFAATFYSTAIINFQSFYNKVELFKAE